MQPQVWIVVVLSSVCLLVNLWALKDPEGVQRAVRPFVLGRQPEFSPGFARFLAVGAIIMSIVFIAMAFNGALNE